MQIGKIIKNFRLAGENKMSMRDFAVLAGLSPSYICMLERGTDQRDNPIVPSIETITKVASVMNMTFDDLYSQICEDADLVIMDDDKDEMELLSMYRYLTASRKEDVVNYVKMLYESEKKKYT